MTIVLRAVLFFLVLSFTYIALPSQDALAYSGGTKGWCGGLPPLGSGLSACASDPDTACDQQFSAWAWQPGATNKGARDSFRWDVKACDWDRGPGGGPAGSLVNFDCAQGYYPQPNGTCVQDAEQMPVTPVCQCDADPSPKTTRPIDIKSGAKFFRFEDFRTADGSLVIERLFNSRSYGGTVVQIAQAALGLGANWRLGFQHEIGLDPNNGGRLELETADGGSYPFYKGDSGLQLYAGNWKYGPPRQNMYKMEYVGSWPANTADILNASSQWKMTDPNDAVWIFQTIQDPTIGNYRTGRPISVTFRGGLQWTFTYGSYHELTSIQDSYGKQITFTWTLQSRVINGVSGTYPTALTSATLPDGTKLNYLYDFVSTGTTGFNASDRLVGVEHRDASNVLLDKSSYLYENSDLPWHVTGILDSAGTRRWTVEYDADGHATASKGPSDVEKSTVAYNSTPAYPTFTRTVTNALGKSTVYTYGFSDYHLYSIAGQASTNSPATNTTYDYSSGYVSTITDAEGRVTQTYRNGVGQPTQIIDGYGTSSARTTNVTWHSNLNVPTEVARPSLTTDYAWNASGQLTQVTQTDTTSQSVPYSTHGQTRTWTFTYNPYGALLTVDGPLSGTGDTVTYTYNSSGYLSSITNEVGQTTTISSIDGRGLPTTIVDPNGVTTSLIYDSEGRLASYTADPSGLSATTTIIHNAVGDVTKVVRPNGEYLQYTYSDARQVTRIEDASGAAMIYTRDKLGNPTGLEVKDAGGNLQLSQTGVFDEIGRLSKLIGASSQTWVQGYDKTDNLVSITDPRANVIAWSFDALNRLIKVTDEELNVVNLTRNGKDEITNYSDPRSLNTGFVRNGFGDVIQSTSSDVGTSVYVYNALGKVTQITDGRGIVTSLSYDNAGRLLTKQYPASTSENIVYTWDGTAGGNKGVGHVTRIDDQSGSIQFSYNALGQVIQETKTTSSIAYTVSYAYDLSGNISQITYPSGRTVNYSRGSTGQVTGVTTKASTSSPTAILASAAAYQPFGSLQTLTYGNGLVLSKSFTQDYNLSALSVAQGSTLIVSLSYGYANGDFDVTSITDNIVAARSEDYTYTASHRLQSASGSWGVQSFVQDSVGNRTSDIFNDGTTTVTRVLAYPSNSNRLSGITQASMPVRTLSYDGAGNVTTDVQGSTTYNYHYNNRSRLDQLTTGSTVTANYTYDGLERMAVRATQNMTPSATTHYIYDRAGHLLVEASYTGAVQREYVWIDNMPLALFAGLDTASPQQWYVHSDHLDRPSKMTDGSGAVVWDAYYWPYGQVRTISGAASNNLRFPGQYFLVESGLNYNWHRHYDPTIGRYLQSDPRGFINGPSTYSYVKSMPTMLVDPLGLAAAPNSAECDQLRGQIYSKFFKLIVELRKYDPVGDAIGGFKAARGRITKPGGHYEEITNLQRGLKNDIDEYNRKCRNFDDPDDSGCPRIPKDIDEAANRPVPKPESPYTDPGEDPGPSTSGPYFPAPPFPGPFRGRIPIPW
jgi:RHS repeat-associated protein